MGRGLGFVFFCGGVGVWNQGHNNIKLGFTKTHWEGGLGGEESKNKMGVRIGTICCCF